MKQIAFALAAGFAAVASPAATFQPGQVMPEARWVAHIDLDQLKGTQVGRYMVEKLNSPEEARKFAALDAMFHLDPRTDLRSLTAFGTTSDEKSSVAIVDADFDVKHIATILGAGEGYSETDHQGDKIMTWLDIKPGRTNRTYGCLLSARQAVIGQDPANVRAAIDTLRGRRPGFQGSALASLLDAPAIPVMMAAADFRNLPGSKPASGIMKSASGGSMSVAETGGNVVMTVRLDAADDARARQVQAIVQGIIALGMLGEADNADFARLCRNAQCALDGNSVTLGVRVSAAEMIEMIKKGELQKARLVAPPPL
jgi:hypothetical protein